MVEIIARAQIQVSKNRYIARGERATVDAKLAEMFVGRGKADYYYPPVPRYETKVILPPPEIVQAIPPEPIAERRRSGGRQ